MSDENIKQEDYISLPPVKKIVIQFLRFIFSIADHLVDVVKKSKLLMLTGFISGCAVGYSYYSSRIAYYEVSMIAQTSAVYRKTLAEMVQSLNSLIITRSYQKLASELKITENQSRQVSYLELTSMQNEPLDNDTSTKLNEPFKIIARINQTGLTDTFQHAIVNYLNNKPSLKTIKEEQVKFNKEKLAFIDRELGKLDSLQSEYNKFFASSKITTTYYSNDVDPANMYKQSATLMDEKGKTLYWLSANSDPLMVIDDFKSATVPQSNSRLRSIVYGGLVGMAICYLIGLFLELYRKMKTYK
jgi:hypothetical protein